MRDSEDDALAAVRELYAAHAQQGKAAKRDPRTDELIEAEARFPGVRAHPRYLDLLRVLGLGWCEVVADHHAPDIVWDNAPWLDTDLELPTPYGSSYYPYQDRSPEWWQEVFPEYREFAHIGQTAYGNDYALRSEDEFFGPSVWQITLGFRTPPERLADDVVEWLLGHMRQPVE